MRKHAISTAVAVVAVGAVGAASALAAQGDNNGNDGNPVVSYVFKGTFEGGGGPVPTAAKKKNRGFFDLGTVDVDHGNAHVWKNNLDGGPVVFDFSNAVFVVGDNNHDGFKNLADVQVGDRVVVKARLRLRDPGPEPFPATQLVDQTH